MTANVRMMYRMILVHPNQHCLQRILWKDNADDKPKTYELTRLTYGTVWAPNLEMQTEAADEESNFPVAASVLRNDFYMDDVLSGAETLSEAKEADSDLKEHRNATT